MTERYTVITKSGEMTFASKESAWDFLSKIGTFQGFTKEIYPRNIEEAVEYHLTYERSGLEGVFAMIRHAEQMRAMAKHAAEIRRVAAASAPRDSHEFRSHFDSTYSGYTWE
jgi:hypothetical protein